MRMRSIGRDNRGLGFDSCPRKTQIPVAIIFAQMKDNFVDCTSANGHRALIVVTIYGFQVFRK